MEKVNYRNKLTIKWFKTVKLILNQKVLLGLQDMALESLIEQYFLFSRVG